MFKLLLGVFLGYLLYINYGNEINKVVSDKQVNEAASKGVETIKNMSSTVEKEATKKLKN